MNLHELLQNVSKEQFLAHMVTMYVLDEKRLTRGLEVFQELKDALPIEIPQQLQIHVGVDKVVSNDNLPIRAWYTEHHRFEKAYSLVFANKQELVGADLFVKEEKPSIELICIVVQELLAEEEEVFLDIMASEKETNFVD